MKQVEKLDRILRYLYERRNDGNRHPLHKIVEETRLPVEGNGEIIRLGKRLMEDGLTDAIQLSMGRFMLRLNSHGVDYCEGHSFESASEPLVQPTTINIMNSQYVSLNSHSAGATASNSGNGAELAARILQEARKDGSLTHEEITRLEELLKSINESLTQGLSSKSEGEELISRYGNLASIGSFCLSLGQMAGAMVLGHQIGS